MSLERPIAPAPYFDRAAISGTLIDRWRAVAEACPESVAIGGGGREFSYGAIELRSNRVAAAIGSIRGIVPRAGAPILVLADHGADAVVAVLAIWKSAGAAVVLDPSLPDARLQALVLASSATLCLATEDLYERARSIGVNRVMDVTALADDGVTMVDSSFRPGAEGVGPHTVGHIVFTSGTTGTPKGVCYPHSTLLHDAWVRNFAGWVSADDVVAEPLPMAFAAGFHDVIGVLLSGGRVLFKDPRVGGTSEFVRWLNCSGATGLLGTPSLLANIAAHLSPGPAFPDSLRLVRSTGERFLARDARKVLDRLPEHCELVNILGSSETGLIASYQITRTTPDTAEPLPVGWPLPDKEICLEVDEEFPVLSAADGGKPAGRLIVRSAFTAIGYHQDPGLTAQVFHKDAAPLDPQGHRILTVITGDLMLRHPDGCLQLLGRKDHTVKVRGYRVEPGEIETALLDCPQVREAIVIGEQRDKGGTRLIAYVTGHDGTTVRPAEIRHWVATRLPSYMIPECVVQLAALPRNERGKLDRAALPLPPGRADFVPQGNDWEQVLGDIWGEILGVEAVGRHDDFFALGGDSLSAQELFARLESQCNVKADSQLLLAAPTLAEFANRAIHRSDSRLQTLIAVKPRGSRPPLFCVAGGGGVGLGFHPLARHLPADQPVWALQARGLEVRFSIPDWSIKRMARRFVRELRSVQPHGPYHLAGHSFGGLVAFELAHQLQDAGEEVALLVVLDSFAPDPAVLPTPEANTVSRRARDLILLAGTGVIPTPGHRHYRRFHRQSLTLSRRYRGLPWSGRTLVVTAADERVPGRANEWSPYLPGQWRLQVLPGAHESLIRDPYVKELAELIEVELAEVGLESIRGTPGNPDGLPRSQTDAD